MTKLETYDDEDVDDDVGLLDVETSGREFELDLGFDPVLDNELALSAATASKAATAARTALPDLVSLSRSTELSREVLPLLFPLRI